MSSDYNDDIGWRARIDSSLSILDQRTSVLDQRSHSSETHFMDLNLKLEGLQKSLEQLISGLTPLSSPWNNLNTANTAMQSSQVCLPIICEKFLLFVNNCLLLISHKHVA